VFYIPKRRCVIYYIIEGVLYTQERRCVIYYIIERCVIYTREKCVVYIPERAMNAIDTHNINQ